MRDWRGFSPMRLLGFQTLLTLAFSSVMCGKVRQQPVNDQGFPLGHYPVCSHHNNGHHRTSNILEYNVKHQTDEKMIGMVPTPRTSSAWRQFGSIRKYNLDKETVKVCLDRQHFGSIIRDLNLKYLLTFCFYCSLILHTKINFPIHQAGYTELFDWWFMLTPEYFSIMNLVNKTKTKEGIWVRWNYRNKWWPRLDKESDGRESQLGWGVTWDKESVEMRS